jgi:fucose permease
VLQGESTLGRGLQLILKNSETDSPRFWLGITVGRVVLGFVTPRVGENLSIILYLLGSTICQLLFWLVPSFIGGAIAVAFVGFFLGPMFPAAVVALTKLLPKHMHVPAIGFSAAFGGGGACVLPFAVGAIAQRAGVQVLQPVIVAMLVLATSLWAIGMPRIKTAGDDDKMSRITAAGKRAGRKISRRCAAFV